MKGVEQERVDEHDRALEHPKVRFNCRGFAVRSLEELYEAKDGAGEDEEGGGVEGEKDRSDRSGQEVRLDRPTVEEGGDGDKTDEAKDFQEGGRWGGQRERSRSGKGACKPHPA